MREKVKKETCNRKSKLDFDEVTELVPAKRGRPFMLGVDLDNKVQTYIKVIRKHGPVINTSIAKSLAKGIISATDRSLLVENSGTKNISKPWA